MSYYLHADLDAFYASVEQIDHPEYKGKPVIVGGLPGDRRSVVSTASYEARKFGVHSAMPVAEAVKRCPDGIFLRGNMKRYLEKSDEVMAVFSGFSPFVQQLSVDEAFLDITGTEKLFGPPEALARLLKKTVFEKTGLTVSAGLASNKYVAKISSGISKPDGLYAVKQGGEEQFMSLLPVSKIWGAGPKTQELFARHGLKTCADIHRMSAGILCSIFGNAFGVFLYRSVRGEAAETFEREQGHRSMSAERTFPSDIYDKFDIESELLSIASELYFRLIGNNLQGRTVFVKIRYGEDFSTESARTTLHNPLCTLNELYEQLLALFYKKYIHGKGIRLLGAGVANLESGAVRQAELFDTAKEKERILEKSIFEINKKYPNAALKRGRLLKP